jgi:membrane-bound metal-dependent hydrolase YbcI (DUF457 family)
MAGYRVHLACSSALGFLYGGTGKSVFEFEPSHAILGAGLTAVGGMLPDLDSDSGVPVREMFGLASVVIPIVMLPKLIAAQLSHEEIIVTLILLYCFIRYGASRFFKRITVHRGMFHSIPAMLIAGMIIFHGYETPNWKLRAFLGTGVMLGFLSHLVLDEIYSVDFRGMTLKLNKYAGSAVKFFSPSWVGCSITYLIFGGLGYFTWKDVERLVLHTQVTMR